MTHQPRILVVDDDPDICDSFRDVLADCGFHVDTALHGQSALQLARENVYDVALLDFRMPDMDGATLCEKLLQIRPNTVAVMITAYAEGDGIRRAKAMGIWRVLRKPVELPEVMAVIQTALNQPTVLLVDDDADFCQSMRDILREQGYRVGIASDVDSAERDIRNYIYDILLLDLKLGNDAGDELLNRIADIRPLPKTVLITGSRDEGPRIERTLAKGAVAACYKPIQIEELLEILK